MANEDKATRYHRLQRRASLAATALGAATLALVLATGASAALRDALWRASGSSFVLTVVLYTAILALLLEAVQAPLAIYRGFVLERRYGLGTQTIGRWLRDHLKSVALGLVFATACALIVLGLIRWNPRDWWLIATLVFAAIAVLLTQLAPVVLLPIFYECRPLDRPTLVARLIALADRAGARALGVFEWRQGDSTRRANAALAGMGRTRRILLSDTLLADHSDDEIEVVIAHELAHHVHHDIWRGIVLDAVVLGIALWVGDRALDTLGARFGLMGKADVAALPVLLLAAGAVGTILKPLGHAASRAHERRADRYALDLTRNVEAFTSVLKRMASRNLADEKPSRTVEVLFHSHPSIDSRIAAAREWLRINGPR